MAVLKELEIKQKIGLGKKAEYNDIPNLYLAATAAKTGYWQVNRTVEGKRLRCTIGKYPDLASKDARRLVPTIYDLLLHSDPKHLKQLCSLTNDPDRIRQFLVGEIASVKTIAPAFEDYARRWWESNIKPSALDPKTIRQKIQQLEFYVFDAIGAKPINVITHQELKELLLPMWTRKGERGGNKAGNETASRLLGVIREIFRVAINDKSNTLVEFNPTPSPRDFPKFKEEDEHHNALPYEEAPAFWKWLTEESKATIFTKAATSMVLLLGKRQKEVRYLKWEYVDFDKALINAPGRFYDPELDRRINYTKNGQPHTTPIPKQLLGILSSVKELTGGNEYALSGDRKKPLSNNTIGNLLKAYKWRDADGRPANTHGARGTLAQWTEDVVKTDGVLRKMILQHTFDTLEKAYAVNPKLRIPMEKEYRETLQQWADYVTGE
jgi:integrase